MQWKRNDLGRWSSEDGQWAALPVGDRWQVMRKAGDGPYDWDRLDCHPTVEAAKAAVLTYRTALFVESQ